MHYYKVFLATAVLMLCHVAVLGAPVADNYQVEVTVKNRTQEVLQEALQLALEQVLVQASGDANVITREPLHQQLAEPQKYVERYEYLPDPDDPGQQKLILHVTFSAKPVQALLKKTGVSKDAASEEGASLHVYGINGLNDFSDVVNYVRALSSVTSVEASTVDADDVILTVKSTAGLEALKSVIANASDHRLQPLDSENNSADSPENMLTYRWVAKRNG